MMKNVAVIILAAGKGERMKSEIPKVLHPLCKRPILEYVLDLVRDLRFKQAVAVIGHKHEAVKKLLKPPIKVVLQKRLLGTADAVKKALPALKNFKGTVLVLYADNPLLKRETIKNLLNAHATNHLDATLLTAHLDKPAGYGRVLRDQYASICGIAEEKDADDFQKEIKEVNTGIMCFNIQKLKIALGSVRPNNRKKEYYLTDTIGILYKKGALIDCVKLTDIDEALGINSLSELAGANTIMQRRLLEEFMKNGITIVDPTTTRIGFGARIGKDTVIYPFTVIEGNVTIARHCVIGPFAHVREGSRIEDAASVGNFAEVARSRLGSSTAVKHFSYIGDARVGRKVNIGAGSVTANFDGKKKHVTVIKDNAFIGSDTVLVAPVTVGKSATTGAGSVVVKRRNVADGSVVAGVPARPLKKVK